MEKPMTQSNHEPEQSKEAASRFRRILAWVVDLTVMTAITQLIFGIIAFVIPPDTAGTMWPSLSVGLVLGFAYLGFATPVFGNTLGKWLFGIKIMGHKGQQMSPLRWFVRLMLAGLWVISGFMMLFSSTRRHLGDLAAKTSVLSINSKRSFWPALGGLLAVVWSANQVGGIGVKIGILNAPSYGIAKTHLEENSNGQPVASFPSGFQLVNDQALFDFGVGEEYHRVLLERNGGSWDVKGSNVLEEPSTETTISFGIQSISNL